jgi:hypothetical protein
MVCLGRPALPVSADPPGELVVQVEIRASLASVGLWVVSVAPKAWAICGPVVAEPAARPVRAVPGAWQVRVDLVAPVVWVVQGERRASLELRECPVRTERPELKAATAQVVRQEALE